MQNLNQEELGKVKFSLLVVVVCSLVYLGDLVLGLLAYGTPIFFELKFLDNFQLMLEQPYRFITPIFLHFHWLHISFNLVIWWFFGRQIETAFGSITLLVVTLCTGFFSNGAEFLATGPNFGGLSGVVFGVIGFTWFYNLLTKQEFFIVPAGLVVQVGILIILGFTGILDFFIGPLANFAHLIGLVSGILLAVLLFGYKKLVTN